MLYEVITRTNDCKTEKCACMRAMRDKKKVQSETTAHPQNGMTLEIQYMGTPIIKDGQVSYNFV